MAIKNVLVVDDSPTDAHVVTGILEKNGFTVISAASGEEGVEVAKAQKPDLVLMDVVMPGMSGFEATRAISKDPETSHIPVIICSGHSALIDDEKARQYGIAAYVSKPITMRELATTIREVLDTR